MISKKEIQDEAPRLVQYLQRDGAAAVAATWGRGPTVKLNGYNSVYDLISATVENNSTLHTEISNSASITKLDLDEVEAEGRFLPPITHPDPAHCLLTGTGLTHLGSAKARNEMHRQQIHDAEQDTTDTMRMFRLGVAGGKPEKGKIGSQPEWFYKGDGDWLVPPGKALPLPGFALRGGEEPEVVAIYFISPNGIPLRVGFALANEFSDHVMERQNYLWLSHSKLRACSIGPELLTGPLPTMITGKSRILRDGQGLWGSDFVSGEENMSHSLANLEQHHFKYPGFRRPGDIHIHFLGTATISFADGIETRPGDVFEISSLTFGRSLRNTLIDQATTNYTIDVL